MGTRDQDRWCSRFPQFPSRRFPPPGRIYEGQKQVLGKIKLNSSSPDDLFVVLSCKLK